MPYLGNVPSSFNVGTNNIDNGAVTSPKLSSNLNVDLDSGSAATPSLTFDANTGLYSPGEDQVAISTGGSGRLFVDSVGNIGANVSPFAYAANARNLQINATGYSALTFGTTDGGTGEKYWRWIARTVSPAKSLILQTLDDAGGGEVNAYTISRSGTAIDYQAWNTGGFERLRITSAGLVGVGTSSPGAQFEIIKDSTFNNEGTFGLSITDGTSDVKLGCGVDATNNISFIQSLDPGTAYNTRPLTLNPNGGNVGIGTSSPQALLDITDASNQPKLRLSTATASNFLEISRSSSTGNYTFASEENGSSIVFATDPDGTGAQNRVTIDRYGKVGIGNTPEHPLDVSGTIRVKGTTDATLFIDSASGSKGFIYWRERTVADRGILGFANGSGDLVYRSGAYDFSSGTERFRCDSSGRLLVGTSSARSVAGQNHLVQLESVNSSPFSGISIVNNANDGNGSYLILGKSRGTSTGSNTVVQNGDQIGGISFAAADGSNLTGQPASITCNIDAAPGTGDVPGRLVFSTTADGASSPTERIRINNKGYFKATATGNYYGVSVDYHELRTANSDWATVFSNSHASNPYGIVVAYTATPNGTDNYFFYAADGTTLRAQIRSNGGLANYSANNANLSDRNAKKDISPAAGTWDCIKEWEIVNYRYKDQPDDADLNLGVIAQQVAESCPEVITVFQEAKDDQPEKLGIKEQQMYWMAIKALQEAQVRIESLEAINADLLARVTALESV